ncbi:MAG: tRNA pseudouridine(38-40) synthase TruA [Armatimonadetes bacterium]|nr:MAG: tRNA pseudouridine(38-40) synthase TruA [Armatimonadota bacterium]
MPRRPPCSNSLTRRIKLTVAYDGTDFCGWAAQAGRRTVQSTLIEAVRRVSGEDTEIVGASRTDSGAHAKGQVCHFDTATPIEPARWTQALNRILPPDVAVCRAAYVSPRFHARFCASDRRYRYRIATGDRDPFADRYAHWLGRTLDLLAMRTAAGELVGEHDFRSFTAELDPAIRNCVRELRSVEVSQVGDEVRIDVVGTAFLRGMMRRIAGLLLEVGRGKRGAEDARLLLRGEGHLPPVLPAKGLTLMRVRYTRPLYDIRFRDDPVQPDNVE